MSNTYYTYSELKKLSELGARYLQNLEEERHILLGVRLSEGHCIARFPNGDFYFPEEMEERLCRLVGHKIACIFLDGQYRIRDLDGEAHA